MSGLSTFSPRIEALAALGIAVLALGGAGYLGWSIGWPAKFNLDDPDLINPITIMILGLLGIAGSFSVKAIRNEARHRAFGNTVLDLDPPGHLRLGLAFSGRLLVQRPVLATGPFRLVLTCLDVHEFEEDGRFRTSDFPVWTAEQTVPPETDATRGLPFRFDLPASVGLDPVPSGILPGTGHRHRATLHVPGMRKVLSGNTPPVGRYWKLVVSAPTSGPDFRAELVIPPEPSRPKGRLP